ncbi:class I SAM-dependent methyltransferase [Flavivirga jejuensis]|uniref:Class I SAM-dependent methyltransferase n=1 Tax=Flavivirga jejuensis TaxID=870487 RepID=A0ABT8WI22_9FLAO|nr:class I SAM-dependent methyltransferase [Flavivirga jejuensis]MDO5972641.1 class I SAM-dependent methyltransferase [Flavivirga jejuensis]
MDKIEIFENERATGYNKFVETWIPNYQYFINCLPKLFSGVTSTNLLVVGCGTGNEIEGFIKAPKKWNITGIDPSPDMIKQATENLQEFDNIRLIEGLITDLDTENKYDAATLLLVLHFLDDNGSKLKLLKDISERLVSGATFVMLDITGTKNQMQQNLQVLKHLLPEGLDKVQIDNRLNRIENKLFPVSEERLSELCEKAGFEKPHRFFQSSIYMGWMTRKK